MAICTTPDCRIRQAYEGYQICHYLLMEGEQSNTRRNGVLELGRCTAAVLSAAIFSATVFSAAVLSAAVLSAAVFSATVSITIRMTKTAGRMGGWTVGRLDG